MLKSLGIQSGDHIAIMSNNCVEWALTDLASQCLGAVTVPIYPNASDQDLAHILHSTQPKLIFLGDDRQLSRLSKTQSENVILFRSNSRSKSDEGNLFWTKIDEAMKSVNADSKDFFSACEKIGLKQTVTIVFTSGTSGRPKGIVLTQTQVLSEIKDIATVFPISSKDLTLSFLPYAHILGRVEMWLSSYAGFTLAFCESIDLIRRYILEVSPTVLIAVPRIFEKIYGSVISRLNGHYLTRIVHEVEQRGFLGSLVVAPARVLLQKQIKERLRDALGGQLKYAISGGAPLSKEVSEFFHRCDVLLLEGYGLTETTGAICVNTPDDYHFGTVGRPLPDVKIKLDVDGEILVKSKKVFDHMLDENDEKKIDEDGFFATGDIGEWTPNGFLRITDRKKDLIKTSGGKYVAPQRIENLFKKYPLIAQSLVFGDQRKFIVALLTLDLTELKSFAHQRKIPFSKAVDLVHSPVVAKEVEEIVRQVNAELAGFESIKRFRILNEELSVERGELTPSLKVRRKFCEEKFKSEIESLYGI